MIIHPNTPMTKQLRVRQYIWDTVEYAFVKRIGETKMQADLLMRDGGIMPDMELNLFDHRGHLDNNWIDVDRPLRLIEGGKSD